MDILCNVQEVPNQLIRNTVFPLMHFWLKASRRSKESLGKLNENEKWLPSSKFWNMALPAKYHVRALYLCGKYIRPTSIFWGENIFVRLTLILIHIVSNRYWKLVGMVARNYFLRNYNVTTLTLEMQITQQ